MRRDEPSVRALRPQCSAVCLVVAVVALLVARASLAAVQVGDSWSPLSLRTWSGTPAKLAAPERGIMLVELWASWCAPCREALPALSRLAAQYREHNVRVVLLNIDRDREKAETFLREILPNLNDVTLLADPGGDAMSRLGAPGMPSLYVVEDGIVRQVEVGFGTEWEALRQRIDAQTRQRQAP